MQTPPTVLLMLLLGAAPALGFDGAPPGLILAGLQLRAGAPAEPPSASLPPPAKPRSVPPASAPVEAPPPRGPLDLAIDDAVRQTLDARAGRVGPRSPVPDAAVYGAPLTADARRALDDITRVAGLDRAGVASVMNTPRDQARFLVEQLFDPAMGEARVRQRYGLPGYIAAESYRRLRDRFQVLDLSATQKQAVVDVTATALVLANAAGQVEDPAYATIDVDPGTHADRIRFERAVAANARIARCVRPSGRDRFYRLEMPRDGAQAGGAPCTDPWSAPALARSDATTSSGDGGARDDRRTEGTGERPDAAPAWPPAENPAGPWRYVVTNGPHGPVVTRLPAD